MIKYKVVLEKQAIVAIAVALLGSLCISSICYSQVDKVPGYIDELKDKGENIFRRGDAAKALGEIHDIRAVDPLIDVLKNKQDNINVRNAAARALGEIHDARAVKSLIDALNDNLVGEYAAKVLCKLKDSCTVIPLLTAYKKFDYLVKEDVSKSLVNIGKPAVRFLIDALRDEDIRVRTFATEVLLKIGTPAEESLVNALKDEDISIRMHAAETLLNMGDHAVERMEDDCTIEPLIDALSDEDRIFNDRLDGLAKSYYRSWDHYNFQQRLIDSLKDKDRSVYDRVITALLNEHNLLFAQTLIDVYKSHWELLERISKALVKIGKPAVEPLIVALTDEDVGVRVMAAEALGQIRDLRAVEPLIDVLRNEKNECVRKEAARALSISIKKSNKGITNALLDGLKEGNLEVIAGAYDFFIRKGKRGSESLLIQALSTYGTKHMAVDFLNSDNSKLRDAARQWAKERGYWIERSPGGAGGLIRWGR